MESRSCGSGASRTLKPRGRYEVSKVFTKREWKERKGYWKVREGNDGEKKSPISSNEKNDFRVRNKNLRISFHSMDRFLGVMVNIG